MEKRLIIAVTLSILIIVFFQWIFPSPKQTTPVVGPGEKAIIKEIEPQARTLPAPPPTVEEKELNAETDKFIITFSDAGGSIKKIQLKDYKKAKSNEPLTLAEESNPSGYIFSIKDTIDKLPIDYSAYAVDRKDDTVTYTLKLRDLEIIKKYILHKSSNSIDLQIFIKNFSSQPKEFEYQIISGSGIVEPSKTDKHLIEVISKVDGRIVNFKRPKNNIISNPGIVSWVALKTRYFSLILKPFGQAKSQFHGFSAGENLFSGIEMQKLSIPANSFVEHKFTLYAGPSIESELKKFGLEFEESINYGFFGPIAKILLAGMALLNGIFHNWGVSIIILSVLLNVLLYPLTLKSFKSMQKMHELHPQMEKLKIQYKDNAQKLNKEIMELYKKYKINPFSGCLPLLLQMPIFIALYQALTKSVFLRGAGFLWIGDLSMPDAVGIPFTLPIVGDSINILPLAMVVLMVVQQKISTKVMGSAVTEEQKQQQKMMLIIMPIMFGFIFYNMPSGMVLYWVVNTVLTIFEQAVIFKNA